MASRNKDERALVNMLTKAILTNSHRVYVHIDRDSGSQRHTSSGWDFLIASAGRVVLCEAKMEKGKLSDWQEYIRATATNAHVKYCVVRFTADLEHFTVDGGKVTEISQARFSDFYEG